MLTIRDVLEARDRIAGLVARTPLEASQTLSRAADAEVFLKCENLQKTGSFKVRGALNRILQISDADRPRGVVAASAGNHAQGVAYASAMAGVPATIVMPRNAAIAKVEATRGYGASVVLAGEDYAEAHGEAERLARETGALLVPAFDDAAVIAGQGTLGLEIVEQLPDVDAIVVPVGGGGLIAGVSVAARSRRRDVAMLAVQPALASTLEPSLAAKRRIESAPGRTIADGLATAGVGRLPWEILERGELRAVTVSEGEIAAAVLLLLERAKMVVEGAAAAALAGALGPLRERVRGRKTVVVLSGGNIDVNLLDRIINLGLVEQGRVLRIATVVPDRPGALSAFAAAIASTGANVKTIQHDRGRVGVGVLDTVVTVELETRGPDHVPAILSRLAAAGYRVERDD